MSDRCEQCGEVPNPDGTCACEQDLQKGGDVQMSQSKLDAARMSSTSPEQQQPSRGESSPDPSLAKAIEIESAACASHWNTCKCVRCTILTAAKSSQDLQERLRQSEQDNERCRNAGTTAQAMVYQSLLMKHEQLEQSCRDDKALIEKLWRIVSFFSSVIKSGESWSSTCEKEIEEAKALQLAHSRGYGKEKG